jgi:hypothetical protein
LLAATPTMLSGTQSIDTAVYLNLTECHSGRKQQRYAKLHSFLEDAVVSRGYQILGSATPTQNVQEIKK